MVGGRSEGSGTGMVTVTRLPTCRDFTGASLGAPVTRLWGGQLYSTHLGSRSAAACCPVLSWCRRSPAPRCPRTSSARCCRGTARAGSCPARHTVARAHCPRVRGPVALPVGTAARAHMVSAAGRNLWAEKHLRHTGGQGTAWSWAPGAALTLWARGP